MAKNLFESVLIQLLGERRALYLFRALDVNLDLFIDDNALSRAQLAQLLNMQLFDGLIHYVPEAKRYADEQLAAGRKIVFDHGALRTVAVQMKMLPSGKQAFSRILEPLGYRLSGEYPLDKLKMCGFVYTHKDLPEDIAQFFVSELYTDRFSLEFGKAVSDLVSESSDPISDDAKDLLNKLSDHQYLSKDDAILLLKELPGCFARHHDIPSLETYQLLLNESAEMAWIATEGNVFNHATDRVSDLDKLEDQEKRKGRAMKPQIEEGQNANIRQTAYRASVVKREFKDGENIIVREVPGSFFEFIQRGGIVDPDTGENKMDLRFDSRNAQGIFKMTR